MFGKLSEQLKQSSMPVNALLVMNAKAMEDFSQQQTALWTGLLSDSVKYLEAVSVQREPKGVLAANSEYVEAMRERLVVASKGTYSTLNGIQENFKGVMKSSLAESTDSTDSAAQTAKTAKPSAAKPKPEAKQTRATKTATTEAKTNRTEENAIAPKSVDAPPATSSKNTTAAAKPVAKKATSRTRKVPAAAKKPVSTTATAKKTTE